MRLKLNKRSLVRYKGIYKITSGKNLKFMILYDLSNALVEYQIANEALRKL